MLSKYSVKRPYTVLVAVALVIVLGVVSLMKMTTDLLPDMSFQYALIITTDVGASPEKVETEVTAPIEAAMATTSNIKNITSTSYNSYSIVTLEYAQNANMDSVVIEIQQKLDQLQGGWSDSVGTPMIMQINPDMLPIMIASVDMEGMSQSELANYVNNDLIPALESVEGVASVSASGALEESVEVTIDQEKVDALNAKIQNSISSKFDDAQKEITDGKNKIKEGQDAIAGSGDEISSAFDDVTGKREELYKTRANLEKQLQDLESKKESVVTLQSAVNTTLQTYALDYNKNAAIISGGKTLLSGVNEQLSAYGLTISYERLGELIAANPPRTDPNSPGSMDVEYNAINTAIAMANAGGMNTGFTNYQDLYDAMTDAKTKNATIDQVVRATYGSNLSALGITVNGYSDLSAAASTIGQMLTKINTGKETISTALNQIDEGLVSLDTALDTINQQASLAAIQVGATSAELATAAASLDTAQTTLDDNKDSALESADLNRILTTETISSLLLAQNFDMPAGYAMDGDTQYLVRVGEQVQSFEELQDLVLMDYGMDEVGIIRLSDVAKVEMVDNSAETYAIVNGQPGIMLSMEKQTGYSTGEVTDRLLERFDLLEEQNDGLHLAVMMNQGVYIDMVVKSVFQNMILGAILAIFVLFLFLKDIKPTVVIACSIPLSVIVAVVLMYFTDISLNIISMSGLVLGIGMLVDNSIVVIENIYRLRNEGYSIKKAAVEGASQVTGAIIASTLTTVSVYAPIIFTEGITRQLFVDLALTIAFTLVASLAVALTFVPAMSSATLKKTKEVKHPWFDRFREWYGRFLDTCLNHKAIVFILAVVLLVGSAAASLSRGLTFMDMEMEADQLSVTISPKEDETLTFEELTDFSDEIIGRISDIEGIDTIGAMAGGSSTMSLMGGGDESVSMYILLDPDSDVKLSQVEDEIAERTKDLDCQVSTESSSMDFSAYFGSGLSIQIKGNDLGTLQELAARVSEVLAETEGVAKVEDGLDDVAPQFTITVDKEKAAEYGYTVAQVFQLVYGEMATSTSATTLTTDIKDYEVYVQTETQSDTKLEDIRSLTFDYTNEDGEVEQIPLTEICDMEETTTLSQIRRDSQNRYLTVSATIDEDHNVTLVGNQVQKALNKMDIPEGYSVTMEGEDETINDAMEQLVLMLILAVIFIYLIMVAQFQSLLSPFIIMFSIPLAFTGGFMGLFITGNEVSVIAMLGFIMLAGLIVNNGIVLIDYINQARRGGMGKREAIIDAGKIRMRPILMTAMTTILAMLTSALGFGDGSAMMQPMAITIIGGLLYGTILTLIVIPCIYDAFNREKSMVEEEL